MCCGNERCAMKRFSLKAKLTLLYTLLMTLVVCGVSALLFSLSGKELLTGVQKTLETQVNEAAKELSFKNGKLRFDSELMSLEHGVYRSVYDADGYLLYGKIPYHFDNSVLFEDGTVRKFAAGNTEFYVMDLFYEIPEYGSVVIRGVSSITEAEKSFRFTIRLALILLPLTAAFTAVVGYLLARRALRPVSQITETVKRIQSDGNLSRRVSLGKGNDEIYRMAETFDQMLEQVESSFRREQQFSSDVSHELRTPVAAMMLQSELLLKNPSLDDATRDGIQMLHQKSSYLSHMIAQLLFLTRADQGRQKLQIEPVNFSELTALACEEAREQLQLASESAAPELAGGDSLPPARSIDTQIETDVILAGDETLLIRLWMNLLQNAITYGKPGGRIWVTLKKEPGEIVCSIRDNGIGISEQDLPHIWERFYQADRARSREDSSGLGLSMVKWIVEAHGGTISVKSRFGAGTEFSFRFPEQEVLQTNEAL